MHAIITPISNLIRTLSVLAILGVLGLSGCGSESERPVVDFSQTVSVARPGKQTPPRAQLRVAVAAMISPKQTFSLYRDLLTYLGRRMGREVEFVQRKTYREVNELLMKGEIDLAFICSGPYATGKQKFGFVPLAVPQVHGSPTYRSYLIVNNDSPYQRLEDLKGRTFAFTDPDSNTGKLVPTFWLTEIQETPETFFGRIIYTYSHDNSILAVSRGLVDGAAVDGLIWEYFQAKASDFTSRTRVIKKSEPYGIPPMVASGNLPAEVREQLQEVLLTMHENPDGSRILASLMIDRFLPLKEEAYGPIRHMHQQLAQTQETGKHAAQKP
jgi:phosphonate transport system substrate-binding protein